VSEFNTKLWNSTTDDNSPARKQARDQKRKLTYISNILVISDPKNPENEGKVFLFKYGKKIFDKISDLMNPKFEGDDPVNPFDLWKGANFKMKICTVDRYRNYDQSTFASPSALSDDDTYLENLWKTEYSLKEFIDPKNFKTYEELKRKMEDVLELNSSPSTKEAVVRPTPTAAPKDESPFIDDDDDEDLASFKALVS
jgi:hypothetical protein